jgi:thiol-disulfide isomerase/thioredoxin
MRSPLLVSVLLALPLLLGSADPSTPANEAAATVVEGAPEPPDPAARDARGWHLRAAPIDSQALLGANEPLPIELPAPVVEHIQRRTVLVYISPSCPHCVAVIPELVDLSRRIAEHSDVLAVFSGFSSRGDVERFTTEQQLPFPWVYDQDKAFATATGLTSTPSVLVVLPPAEPGSTTVAVGDAYMPYPHGADAVLEMRLLGESEPVLARGAWLGAVTCGACHTEEVRSHAMTLHSVAYYHMVDAGGVDDPSCLACHVTHPVAAWEPGQDPVAMGFRPGDHRSPWSDVSCEACHTASGPHDGDGGDPRAVCTSCHAPDHVPFDAEQGLALIDHFAGSYASDAEVQAWRSGVATGEADRPMVTMAAGPSVGVKGCAACHKPQARQWRKTPHAHAMSRLEGEDAGKVGCVICHATPVDSSVRVDGVEGFRTDESIGCEICHGPGQGHAADPAANPLWSLRTREPACFVEGVCVRCHNEIRDPDFQLEAALQAVGH